VARIKRRNRVQCRLPCEIVVSAKKRVQGRVVTLSEGGLAVVTDIQLDQGDPIRLAIDPNGARPIKVSGIVWNDSAVSTTSGGESRLRRLGCIISQPSGSFAALLGRLLPKDAEIHDRVALATSRNTVPIAPPRPRDPAGEWAENDLPRSRELQPPTKVEPEESLPYFRIRLKQIGGPRTRILTLQARSATQAEQRALEELDSIVAGRSAEVWGVLHISKISGGAR